jgi:hypothetical protein
MMGLPWKGTLKGLDKCPIRTIGKLFTSSYQPKGYPKGASLFDVISFVLINFSRKLAGFSNAFPDQGVTF